MTIKDYSILFYSDDNVFFCLALYRAVTEILVIDTINTFKRQKIRGKKLT